MTFQWKTTSLVSVQTWCHTSKGLGKRSGQTGRKSAKQIPWITECIDPWFDCPINLTPITLVQKRSSACVDQNSNRQIESLKLTFLIINWNKWVVCQFAIQHSWIRYKMPFLIYSDSQIKAFFLLGFVRVLSFCVGDFQSSVPPSRNIQLITQQET